VDNDVENNLNSMLTTKMDTLNNCSDVACLKFKLPCDKTTDYFRTIHIVEGSAAD